MSTYNGQKYLREQLDSILNQEGVDVSLLIRDDGSKDDTIDILKEYAECHPNIEYIQGENLGFADSFMDLIYRASEYKNIDYFALSDQDDVWLPNKLYEAIKILGSRDSNKLQLYFSNTFAVDDELKVLFKTHERSKFNMSKESSLVQYFILGCTMVFNKKVVDYLTSHKPIGQIAMHDLWIHQTCAFFGEITYDDEPRILYRQHASNIAGIGRSLKKRIARLMKSMKSYRRRHFREMNARCFLQTYDRELSIEDHNLVSAISNYRDDMRSRFHLLFSNRMDMGSKLSNLNIKFRILFGLF